MAKKSEQKKKQEEQAKAYHQDSSDDEVSSEEEGEDLILEGVLVRNPDIDSSDDDDSDDEEEKQPPAKKAKKSKEPESKKKKQEKSKKKKAEEGPEIIPVDFTFNDMDDKYFHGIKNYLLAQPAYAGHSSAISDIMIENIAVGTVVSTADGEDNVFGFASVLNVTTYQKREAIKKIKTMLLNACPKQNKSEMEVVLSGKTKRPAGIFIHGRMVNLPLEITYVLHEQLVKDMEWAVKNAHGGEEERKSLNFGAFVVLAPCTRDNTTHATMYKNFDDEIFAGCAEFVYTISSAELRKSAGGGAKSQDSENEDDLVNVIVLTRTGHTQAMKELKEMIHG